MSSKIKVLQVIPKLGYGGAETGCFDLAHFLNENNFVCIKMFVKQGWKDRESGRIGDPRIQYLSFHQLQDSLTSNAKRIIIKVDAIT